MKSLLRSSLTAVALAAGAAALQAPAIAQQVVFPQPGSVHIYSTVAVPVAIDRFIVETRGQVEAGESVRYRLTGTPGGRAVVRVPYVRDGAIQLVEVRPGLYEAARYVQPGENPQGFILASASLQAGGRQAVKPAPEVHAGGRHRDDEYHGGDRRGWEGRGWERRDVRPPVVSEVTPANGSWVDDGRRRVRIEAHVTDDRSGVDHESIRLRVDGRDVTQRVRFDGDTVRYRDDLGPGRHVAELFVRDRAGNETRQAWSFVVADRERERWGRQDDGASYGIHFGWGNDR